MVLTLESWRRGFLELCHSGVATPVPSVGDPGVTTGPLELLLLLGDPRGLARSFPRGSNEPRFIFILDEAV